MQIKIQDTSQLIYSTPDLAIRQSALAALSRGLMMGVMRGGIGVLAVQQLAAPQRT